MKHILKLCFLFLLAGVFSCQKNINTITYQGGTPPVLTPSRMAITVSYATRDEEAVKLSWTNPTYQFTTGTSSQDVAYVIEIDTTGANFTNQARKKIGVSKEQSISFTQGDLNDYMLNQLNLTAGVPHAIEMRVTASLANSSLPLYSNVLKYTLTPYAIPPKVAPPTNQTLWLLGDATNAGWTNPMAAPYTSSQMFTRISNTIYEITVALPGGGGYKLIQEQGIWSTQYHMVTNGTWEGGDFVKEDANPAFSGPPSAGNYKITVDFQRGKFTVTKL